MKLVAAKRTRGTIDLIEVPGSFPTPIETQFKRAFSAQIAPWNRQNIIPWDKYDVLVRLCEEYAIELKSCRILEAWRPLENTGYHTQGIEVAPGGYLTSHLGVNSRSIRGGKYISTVNGIVLFEELFRQSQKTGFKSDNFGEFFEAPCDEHNLTQLITKSNVDLDTKLEAFVKLYQIGERTKAIKDSIYWRLNTHKVGNGLHQTVGTTVPNKLNPLKKKLLPIEEVELWKNWLKVYEPYSQQKITAAASYRAKRVGWWIDMRVGKTASAMMLMARALKEQEVSKFVVVAPAINLFDPWFEELENQHRFRVCILEHGPKIDEALIESEEYDIYLVSYTSLPNRLHLMQKYWAMDDIGVVGDETSAIKNPDGIRSKSAMWLTEHTRYAIALNGTPLAQGAADIWSQQMFVDQGSTFGISYSKFLRTWMTVDQFNKPTLKRDLKIPFELTLSMTSIRYIRSEADQFKGKDKGFRYITLPPTEEIRRGTDNVIKGFVRDADGDIKFINDNILTVYGHLRECCAAYDKFEEFEDSGNYIRQRHKIDPKTTWIKVFLASNPAQPLVIFSEFSEAEDRIMEMLEIEGIKYSSTRPRGSKQTYKGHERKAQIDAFQNGDTRVFLMKSRQGKGVTLNRLPAVKNGIGTFPAIVYTQPTWSLIDWEQSQDRCVGTIPEGMNNAGKSIHTQIFVLIIDGSIEDKIVSALRGKKKVAESLLADVERSGYVNPFEEMDLSSSSKNSDEVFDAEDLEARYNLKIAPYKKLSEKMILDADAKYKARINKTTQKAARQMPNSEWAEYLLSGVKK